jgi:hypothetical protein
LEDRIVLSAGFRTIDGVGNNVAHPDWGAADSPLLRLTTVEYGGDGSGDELAPRVDSNGNTINPRTVSNLVMDQPPVDVLNDRDLSSFVFQWGQFLDHDLDLTEDTPPVGRANEDLGLAPVEDISYFVPTDGTEQELPDGSMIPMLRSRFELDEHGVRQQVNQITSYIDASNVYGSDSEKAEGLRAHYSGFLLTSDGAVNVADGTGDFLPFNTLGLENAAPPTSGTGVPLDPEGLFIAGDVRSNEQPALTVLHTLFVREHNRLAREIAAEDFAGANLAEPAVDEAIYQRARQLVGAELQAITYNEFLPALLGPDGLGSYEGYDPAVNAGIANIFAHAVYRVGHTMLPNELLLLTAGGAPVPDNPDVLGASVIGGEVALGDAFFNPELITSFGIEPYLYGLTEQQIQEIDHLIVDGVRNLLFDPPAAIDLGSTNLQRGRDHGLPDYNQARVDFGLPPVRRFPQINRDPAVWTKLAAAYSGDVNNIDPWMGAVSEKHIGGGSVGELIHSVLVHQFTSLRDGDRFYYEKIFSGGELAEIQNTRLSDVILRNTSVTDIRSEVFRDESVFVYRHPAGDGPGCLCLRVRRGQVQVYDKQQRRVVASRPLAQVTTVVLFGTDKNDKITIDSTARRLRVPIEVHGDGGADVLIVKGTPRPDRIIVKPHEIRANRLRIYHGNFESIHVYAGAGRDVVNVKPQVVMPVLLHGGRGNDRLIGGNGDDVLIGAAGWDQLYGRGGDDALISDGAEERVVGGRGSDMLLPNMAAYLPGHQLLRIMDVWHSVNDRDGVRRDYMEPANIMRDNMLGKLFAVMHHDWGLDDPF